MLLHRNHSCNEHSSMHKAKALCYERFVAIYSLAYLKAFSTVVVKIGVPALTDKIMNWAFEITIENEKKKNAFEVAFISKVNRSSSQFIISWTISVANKLLQRRKIIIRTKNVYLAISTLLLLHCNINPPL